MKHSNYFNPRFVMDSGWWLAIYLFMGIFWSILLAIALTTQLNTNLILQWFLISGLLVGVKGAALSRSVVRGSVVLRQLRTPKGLQSSYLSAVVVNTTTIWLVFCTAGSVLLLVTHFAWSAANAFAFNSIVLSLCALSSLPSSNIAMRIWKGFLYILAMLLTPVMMWNGYVNPIDYLLQMPMWLIAIMVLSWPLTIFVIVKKWEITLPTPALISTQRSKGFRENFIAYTERFTQLVHSRQKFNVKPTLTAKLTSLITMQYLCLTMLTNIADARWGKGVGSYHIFGILMITSLCCNLLIFKDLHWRSLLMPDRFKRNYFGWHIFSFSVIMQLLVYVVFASIWTLVAWLYFDIALWQTLERAWDYRAVPMVLLAANSLAVLLLSQFNSRWAGIIFMGVAVVFAGLTFMVYGFTLQTPIWFYVGTEYVIGLLLFTMVCVFLSNRHWTRQRVLLHLPLH